MNLKKDNLKFILWCFFITFIGFLLRYHLFEEKNSWHDEWHSIYVSDPNISLHETLKRYWGDKGDEFLTEFYPPLYLIILKYYFSVFGYIDDYGRFLSLIFGTLTIPLSIILSRKIGIKKEQIYIPSILVTFNLFLIWQSLEIRAHSILVFFSLLNILLFYKLLNKNNRLIKILYIMCSIFTLSLWPISGTIFFGKSIYLIKDFFLKKSKNLEFFKIFFIILIFYIIINYDYLLFQLDRDEHYTKLVKTFFLGFHFRSFFGSIFIGAIFLITFAFIFIKNIKQLMVRNDEINILIYIVLSSYFLTLTYSLLRAPIMSPKYVIFLVPLIIIWISYYIDGIFNKYLIYIVLIVSIIVSILNIQNYPIKRPPSKEMLNFIVKSNIKNIVTNNNDVFNNYLKTKKISIVEELNFYNISYSFPKDIRKFWFVCLNFPRFAYGETYLLSKNSKPQEHCTNFNPSKYGFKEILPPITNIEDFYLRRFEK